MSKACRILVAFLLGLVSFPLMFLLGEGVSIPSSIQAAGYIEGGIFISVLGGYFFISGYLLSHRNPQAIRKDWFIILTLTFTLIVTAVVAFIVEPNRSAVMGTVGMAVLAVALSFSGAALAARAARH